MAENLEINGRLTDYVDTLKKRNDSYEKRIKAQMTQLRILMELSGLVAYKVIFWFWNETDETILRKKVQKLPFDSFYGLAFGKK